MKRLVTLLCQLLVLTTVVEASSLPKWVWIDDKIEQNTWACFRKSVTLSDIPDEEVKIDIAVDSKYWLWVNDEQVMFEGGLAGSPSQAGEWTRKENITPSNTWYESVDIKPYLKEGENVISVLVWYWGRETHKGTYIKKRGGLFLDCDQEDIDLSSNNSWKASRHMACDTTDCVASKSVVQFKVKYDGRSSMDEWYMSNFDDSEWANALEIGEKGDAPWYDLESKIVPNLVNHGLMPYANDKELGFPFVSKGGVVECVLPINKQITPYLEVESENGGEVIFITTDNNRNAVTSEYTTRAGKQSFESYTWTNGHIVKYTIPEGVKVLSLKYRWMSVGEMAGKYEVNDPFYQRLWDMGFNTLFVCARDNFMDCPDRERALWIGDVADQTSYLFYCMDGAGRDLLKSAILSTMYFSENKVFGALGPLRVRELVCQSLQFISQCVLPYYMNTGDKETLAKAYPYIYDYLDLFPMAENGLPEYRKGKSPDSWDWLDWGVKETVDKSPIQPAFYYMALKEAKQMAIVLGEDEHIEWYDKRMKSIEENYDKIFWKDGFYSSDPSTLKDDRANALAIVSGLASQQKAKEIVENVLTKNFYCSPHFEWIVEEAMCMAGEHDEALARMKTQYQSQVDNVKMTTLYEKFPNGGSYNHAWNAPNAILAKHIAGIYPVAPAWEEFAVKPNMAHFKSIKQSVPTVKGDVTIELVKDSGFMLNVEVPQGTKGLISIPKAEAAYKSISVNGKEILKGKKIKSLNGVSYIGEDSQYINFSVESGAWSFIAK